MINWVNRCKSSHSFPEMAICGDINDLTGCSPFPVYRDPPRPRWYPVTGGHRHRENGPTHYSIYQPFLVGGWATHLKNMSQKRGSSPNRGENLKENETTTSNFSWPTLTNFSFNISIPTPPHLRELNIEFPTGKREIRHLQTQPTSLVKNFTSKITCTKESIKSMSSWWGKLQSQLCYGVKKAEGFGCKGKRWQTIDGWFLLFVAVDDLCFWCWGFLGWNLF